MNKYKFIFTFGLLFIAFSMQAKMTVQTVWGDHTIDDPFLEELIESEAMQRLKYVDQSGPVVYFNLCPKFRRFDHCVGVLVLLMKAGVSRIEQAAGLLHDASHTAYSHLGDYLFHYANATVSYQDLIHLDFLKAMGVDKIVEKYGYTLEQLDPDLPEYTALERPRPELCADRIQYFIQTGVIFEAITADQAQAMVEDLKFENGIWFFQDQKLARIYAMMALHFTQYLYNTGWNCALYHYFEQALRRAMEIDLISKRDIKFGTDLELLDRLQKSSDEQIQQHLTACGNVFDHFSVTKIGQGDKDLRLKFWGVDPLVQVSPSVCSKIVGYKVFGYSLADCYSYLTGKKNLNFCDKKLVCLSKLDKQFKQDYDDMVAWCRQSYAMKYF